MLRANDIVPRNPEPPEPLALDTQPTSMSSGKGGHVKVEEEVESGSEDEDSMREKALLVRFRFHIGITYCLSVISPG